MDACVWSRRLCKVKALNRRILLNIHSFGHIIMYNSFLVQSRIHRVHCILIAYLDLRTDQIKQWIRFKFFGIFNLSSHLLTACRTQHRYFFAAHLIGGHRQFLYVGQRFFARQWHPDGYTLYSWRKVGGATW